MVLKKAIYEMGGREVTFRAAPLEGCNRVVVEPCGPRPFVALQSHDQDTRFSLADKIFQFAYGFKGTGSDTRDVLNVINQIMGDY